MPSKVFRKRGEETLKQSDKTKDPLPGERFFRMKTNSRITKATHIDRGIYHWMQDQGTACIWGIAEITDALEYDRIKKSFQILIKMVPLLGSRLKLRPWGGGWESVDSGNLDRCIIRKNVDTKQQANDVLKDIFKVAINMDRPPYFRIITIDCETAHYLVFQVHHVIVDGEGAKQLFNLFANIYRELQRNPDWQPKGKLDMNRSWRQFLQYLKWHQFIRAPFESVKETIGLTGLLMGRKKTSGVIKGDTAGKTDSLFPTAPFFETIEIDNATLACMKNVHFQSKVKVNDMIMAGLMTTINQWNRLRCKKHSYLATIYTANLRRWWGQPSGIFANMSVIRFVRIKTEDAKTVHQTMEAVKRKIDKAKKVFGIKEIWELFSMAMQPEIIARGVGKLILRLCKEGHGLTNIGIIPESAGDFGHVKATAYSLLAPPLASPCVIFTASSYRNHLTVHGNFNTIHFKVETAKKFMEKFRLNLMELTNPCAVPITLPQITNAPVSAVSTGEILSST